MNFWACSCLKYVSNYWTWFSYGIGINARLSICICLILVSILFVCQVWSCLRLVPFGCCMHDMSLSMSLVCECIICMTFFFSKWGVLAWLVEGFLFTEGFCSLRFWLYWGILLTKVLALLRFLALMSGFAYWGFGFTRGFWDFWLYWGVFVYWGILAY